MSLNLAASQASRTAEPATVPCGVAVPVLPSNLPRRPVPRVDGYEILERLGAGGMGVVFKARHRQLNRIVALKMLGAHSLADVESHRRFQSEAEAVARLQHPNIIQVFDVGAVRPLETDLQSRPYLSLEYVDGGNLHKQTLTPQDPRSAARLLEKVARAVHAAHQVGVVHRDLKPANVLLTSDGEPKIADFGVAKQIHSQRDENGGFLTQDGTALGTPEYMAPEQVDGQPATPAFDIYSLGVMLYELLTARQPFKGATVTETMLLVKCQEPVPPSHLQPTLPRDLETICLKCLAKAPAGRYATAEQLADDLGRWLTGRPILARPVSPAERLGRWAKRNPPLAGVAALAVALAVAGVSGVTWKWRDAEGNARLAEGNARLAEAKVQEADDRRRDERWELYRACIATASSDMRMSTLSRTNNPLETAPAEYRNWEWRHFRHQMDLSREVFRLDGPRPWTAVPISGEHLLVSQEANHWLWDVSGRRAVSRGGEVPPSSIPFPDGGRFTFHRDAELVIRSADGRTADVVLKDPAGPLRWGSVSADGNRVLAVCGPQLRVWETATGLALPSPAANSPAIGITQLSSDGRLAAANLVTTAELVVWDVDTGRTLLTVPDVSLIYSMRFSPDGSRLAVNETFPKNTVRLWDVRTGKPCGVLTGHTNAVLCMAYSPDGKVLATASRDQTVRLWDTTAGEHLHTLTGHRGLVNSVAFSDDGRRLVSASEDTTVRVWAVDTANELYAFCGHANEVFAAAFTDGGATVASVSRDGTIRYWDARPAAGGVWAGHTGFVYSIAYHPDGKHLVSASWDHTARIWDATGREVGRLDHGKGEVCSIAVHPNGRWVATLTMDETARLWDFDTRELLHTWDLGPRHWKTGRVAFHPTDALLACGCGDGSIRLLDVARRERVAVLQTGADAIRDVAFSPDGRWLAAAGDSDHTVHVWDVTTRSRVAALERHADAVYSLAFSPNGRLLASGSTGGDVHLWATADWHHVAKLEHGVKVYGLAFTPDGTRLACGNSDNTVRLWDVARRQQVAELRGHSDYVHSLAFARNGTRLATASGDHTVRVWDAPPDAR